MERTLEITTEGTCCRRFTVTVDGGRIKEVAHLGGCSGNLDALSVLLRGMEVSEVVRKFSGLTCGTKGTSCMDQLARGLARQLSSELVPVKDPAAFGRALVERIRSFSYGRTGEVEEYAREDGSYGPKDVEEIVNSVGCCYRLSDEDPDVSYGSENFCCLKDDEDIVTFDPEMAAHLGWHDEGYVEFRDGGDWQHPVVGMLYLVGGRFKTYFPRNGNVFDHRKMEAWDMTDFEDGADGYYLEREDGTVEKIGKFDYGLMEKEFVDVVVNGGAR